MPDTATVQTTISILGQHSVPLIGMFDGILGLT
jgi:hypothetical protein